MGLIFLFLYMYDNLWIHAEYCVTYWVESELCDPGACCFLLKCGLSGISTKCLGYMVIMISLLWRVRRAAYLNTMQTWGSSLTPQLCNNCFLLHLRYSVHTCCKHLQKKKKNIQCTSHSIWVFCFTVPFFTTCCSKDSNHFSLHLCLLTSKYYHALLRFYFHVLWMCL